MAPAHAAGSDADCGQFLNSNNTIYRPFNSWQPLSLDTERQDCGGVRAGRKLSTLLHIGHDSMTIFRLPSLATQDTGAPL